MKTQHSIWSWLLGVFSSASSSTVKNLEPRPLLMMDTPEPFTVAELRWA